MGLLGRRGPPPTPTAIKQLRGNPGKRAIRKEPEPKPPKSLQAPEFLKGNARAEWERCAPELAQLGLLTDVDLTMFAAYCEAFATWRQYEGLCEEHGAQLGVQMGYRNAADRAAERMVKFGARFGLDPSSRTNVKATPPGEKEADDKRSRFFGIPGGKPE